MVYVRAPWSGPRTTSRAARKGQGEGGRGAEIRGKGLPDVVWLVAMKMEALVREVMRTQGLRREAKEERLLDLLSSSTTEKQQQSDQMERVIRELMKVEML